MIEVIDRVPTHPGRVKLVPVPGQANTYDMVRADEPVSPGTPINRALFESIRGDISLLSQNVANIINEHAALTLLGGLPVGSEFGIYENGVLVPYIKVSGDYNGTARNAVIRKNIIKMDFANTQAGDSKYEDSVADLWLNNEYLWMLDSVTQNAIEPVTITYSTRNSNVSVAIDRKIFLGSLTEFGWASNTSRVEGTRLPYFSTRESCIALYNGAPSAYWTRTSHPDVQHWLGVVVENGTSAYMKVHEIQAGYRPMFTLPFDYEANVSVPSTANTVATAEVI